MFNKIMNEARESRNRNIIEYKKIIEEEKKVKANIEAEKALKNAARYTNVDYRKDCYSKELLALIDKYEFEILSYEKNFNISEDDIFNLDQILEIYRCKFNNWHFEIKNYSDYDIEEGIFVVTNIKNVKTNEEIIFNCDLGCRNSNQQKLNNFLSFLKYDTEKEYVQSVYGEYLQIPFALIKEGLTCNIIEESLSLQNPVFIYEIDYSKQAEKCKCRYYKIFINVKLNVDNNPKLYITDNYKEQHYAFLNYGEDLVYTFPFENQKDLMELMKCLDAYYEHINGNIGFLQNGKRYKNRDAYNYFDKIIKDDSISNKRNSNFVRIEDYNGHNKQLVNKYNGLELFVSKSLVLGDAGYWSEGEEINNSKITICYDTNIDKDNCILNIKNYIYKNSDDYMKELFVDNDYCIVIDDLFKVDEIEFKGSYLDVINTVDKYINELFDIYNIRN